MKRIISIVLVLAICCGMFAVMAMAAENYSDVKENDWFAKDVNYVSDNDLMNGVGNNKFGPNETTTRAMVATILWRIENSPEAKTPSGYADVADGKWYSNAIAWMKEVGLTNGKGNNMFGTEDPITREELATFLYRYWQTKSTETVTPADLGKFVDGNKVNAWAREAVSWAAGYPILSGKPGPAIDPQGRATRAELAAMLHRYIDPSAIPTPPIPDGKKVVSLEAYWNDVTKGYCYYEDYLEDKTIHYGGLSLDAIFEDGSRESVWGLYGDNDPVTYKYPEITGPGTYTLTFTFRGVSTTIDYVVKSLPEYTPVDCAALSAYGNELLAAAGCSIDLSRNENNSSFEMYPTFFRSEVDRYGGQTYLKPAVERFVNDNLIHFRNDLGDLYDSYVSYIRVNCVVEYHEADRYYSIIIFYE